MASYRLEDLSRDHLLRWLTAYHGNLAYVVLSNRTDRLHEETLGRWSVVDVAEPGEADPFEDDGEQSVDVQAPPAETPVDTLADRLWEWISDQVSGEFLDQGVTLARFRLKFYAIKGSKLLGSPSFSAQALVPQRDAAALDVFAAENPAVADPMRSAMALLLDGAQRVLDMSHQVAAQALATTREVSQISTSQMRGLQQGLDRAHQENTLLIEALTGAKLAQLPGEGGDKPRLSKDEATQQVLIAGIEQVGKAVELLALGRAVSPEQRELLGKLSQHPRLGPMLARKGLGKLLDNEEAVDMLAKQLDFLTTQMDGVDEAATTPPHPGAEDAPPFE